MPHVPPQAPGTHAWALLTGMETTPVSLPDTEEQMRWPSGGSAGTVAGTGAQAPPAEDPELRARHHFSVSFIRSEFRQLVRVNSRDLT